MMKHFLLALGLILTNFLSAQVSAEIDTARIKLGQPIHYKLTVPFEKNDQIILPKIQDTLSFHLEILDQKIDTIQHENHKKLVQNLTITSFDPGEFLIRSLPVVINGDTILANSLSIQVDDVEIDTANLTGFPIKPIMEEEFTWKDYWDKYWVYILIGVLVFVILLTIAILYLRNQKNKKDKTYIVLTPYQEAKDLLKKLDKKNHLNKGNINEYYSELSYIIRNYVGKIYKFSSLEMLSDDLVQYFRSRTHLEKEDLQKFKEFLYDSDLAKFAKSEPESFKNEMYRKWIEELIDKTQPLDIPEENLPEIKPNEKFRKINP